MTTDRQRKKDLVAEYKQTFRPMGVYQIRNLDNGKIFVAGSMNLDAARNRHEFTSLRSAQPPIPELHADWTRDGGTRFVFEELDRLTPREGATATDAELKAYREELDALVELWLEKLQPYGERGYNKRRT
jgi:hypothetical protein